MGKEMTSIVFTGDIAFDRYLDRRWEDNDLLPASVLSFFHDADHVVANVEGALFNAANNGEKGGFFHAMNPEAAGFLQKIGANIWCIGNNHAMDAGKEGMLNTRRIASAMGCRTIGAGLNEEDASEPVYLNEGGGIGVFNVSYTYPDGCIPATALEPGVFRWDDMTLIKRRIDEVKSRCRWCVIVSHGGEEYASMPNPYTRDRYIRYLAMGADVVVGHHPHVAENYELLEDGKAIFYSLGNFLFDTNHQRAHMYTDAGVLLKLFFTKRKMTFEAMGTRLNRDEERIAEAPLPDIFTNISLAEYTLLSPLAAKAFIAEDMRKMVHVKPEQYSDASEETWNRYFFVVRSKSYSVGSHMDFDMIVPLSKLAEDGSWRYTQLEKVKEYLLRLL